MSAIFKLLILAVLAIPVSAQAGAIDDLQGSGPEAQPQAPAPVPQAVVNTPPGVFFDNIEIFGDSTFVAKTEAALTLLEGSTTFTKISPYIAGIKEDEHSGMQVHTSKPFFSVGSTTWNRGGPWYAGAIAHDTYHSLLYFKAKSSGTGEPPDDAWQGKTGEQKCLAVQAEVLTEIKADKYLVDYVKSLISDPTYQNVPYDARSW